MHSWVFCRNQIFFDVLRVLCCTDIILSTINYILYTSHVHTFQPSLAWNFCTILVFPWSACTICRIECVCAHILMGLDQALDWTHSLVLRCLCIWAFCTVGHLTAYTLLVHSLTTALAPLPRPPHCHMDGLCFWYLAGSMELTGWELVRALVNGGRGPWEGFTYLERPPADIRRSILYRLTAPFVKCLLAT